MTFKYRYRKQIIMGICIFLVLIFAGVFSFIMLSEKTLKKNKSKSNIILVKRSDKKSESKSAGKINSFKVDIKGEVNNPGIYTLDEGSRVYDVIQTAGGLTDQADTSVINLSLKISDEMVIIVYSKNQVSNFLKTKSDETIVRDKCIKNEDSDLLNDACIKNNDNNNTSKISINTAGIDELSTLSGVGKSKAENIIKYREENGEFKSIEDIKKVDGIGEGVFVKIKENITL